MAQDLEFERSLEEHRSAKARPSGYRKRRAAAPMERLNVQVSSQAMADLQAMALAQSLSTGAAVEKLIEREVRRRQRKLQTEGKRG